MHMWVCTRMCVVVLNSLLPELHICLNCIHICDVDAYSPCKCQHIWSQTAAKLDSECDEQAAHERANGCPDMVSNDLVQRTMPKKRKGGEEFAYLVGKAWVSWPLCPWHVLVLVGVLTCLNMHVPMLTVCRLDSGVS